MDLERDLSEPQRLAVRHGEGPLLVLAGAGSGKTRVITWRIAHLVAVARVEPWRILAVTFTNKAAGEMRERVARLLGPAAAQVWLGTFHATCARLLRRHPDRVGLRPEFTIYDEDDTLALIGRVLRDLGIDADLLPPREVRGRIDRAKQDALTPDAIAGRSRRGALVARVWTAYDARLRESNAVDFGDLLVLAVRLLDENGDVREALRARFAHVLVDEFQDTNRIQFRLLELLLGERRSVCVVGDDDQSIYRWRGAEVRNILEFEKHFPGAVVVRLEQNYRSTAHVLSAAAAVVGRNESRHPKELWTANPAGDPVRVVTAGDEREEAAAVVRLAETLRAEGTALADQAVFYRTHAQSRALEEALRGREIPYVVVGGFRFYERAEVKNLLAYLRLLVNPSDDVGFLRIVNVPARGIGKVTVERLAAHARATGRPLLATAADAAAVPEMPAAGARSLTALAGQISTWRDAAVEGPAAVARRVLEESGYRGALEKDGSPEGEARLQNVGELVGSIGDWAREAEAPTLGGYLEHVTLQTAVDELDGKVADRLALMTVHSAKGLEFDTVFVVGLEDGLFPFRRRGDEDDDEGRDERRAQLEEERRLCYVAMTRARRRLWLFHALARRLFGAPQVCVPSRFLADLPKAGVEQAALPGARAGTVWGAPGPAGGSFRPGTSGNGWRVGEGFARDDARGVRGGRRGRAGGDGAVPSGHAAGRSPPARRRDVPWEDAPSPALEQEICQAVAEEAGLDLRVGDKVRSARFGVGRVVDIESGAEVKLSIDFPGWGRKKLIARFVERA